MRRPRASVRARLTGLYALLFLACGSALIGVNYSLLRAWAYQPATSGVSVLGVVITEGPTTTRLIAGALALTPLVESRNPREEQLRQAERARALNAMLVSSLFGLGFMAFVAVGLGWIVAGRALRPIHDITAAARRASEHNLRERIALAGPRDELRELADTLDGLLARLDAAFEVQRRFADSASRELRAPLTAMRTAIEGALAAPEPDAERYRRMAREVQGSVERANRLIDGLLTLAHSQEEPRAREPADLGDAASDALAAASREAAERGLELLVTLGPAPVRGVRTLVERAVAELVANGVAHNRPGGLLEVTTGVEAGSAFLLVRSDGEPIGQTAVDTLFEPFQRLRAEGKGPGLGLAIARSVAVHHGGRLDAQARQPGGLTVRMTLPANSALT